MIFHLRVLVWTLVFFAALEFVTLYPLFASWRNYLLSILLLVIISLWAGKSLAKHYMDSFIPGLLAVVTPTLLGLIDHPGQRQIFIVLAAFMIYFSFLGIYRLRHAPEDKTAKAFLYGAAMAAMFFFFSASYGFYLNFSFPLWGLMLLYFSVTAVMMFEMCLGISKREHDRVVFYSVLVGLVMSELAWVMSFWPFGYLTTGALALIFFFMLWEVAIDTFRKSLSLKKVVVHFALSFGLAIVLAASSPWRILV
jgi:hypothetical protein